MQVAIVCLLGVIAFGQLIIISNLANILTTIVSRKPTEGKTDGSN